MEIYQDKALIFRVKNPEAITNKIPKSHVLHVHDGVSSVLVHWGQEESEILATLNLKSVPSPIVRDYKWTGMYTPFFHQRETANFLTLHRKAFCFNEAGTGKTAAAIWAADYLMSLGVIKRVLVACPVSVMQNVWVNELFKTAMHRHTLLAHGNAKIREDALTSNASFVVTNYETITLSTDAVLAGNFDLIIVDEANAYKNTSTARWKALNKVMVRQNPRLWMMTGTPAAQSPMDAFGLAKLVRPEACPKYKGDFQSIVMQKVSNFRYIPRPKAQEIVYGLLQPAIRFTKDECLDLPPVMYVDVDVPLSAQQKKYYEIVRKELVMEIGETRVVASNAAVAIQKLLQISGGAVYSTGRDVVEFDCTDRLSKLESIIDETTNKVLVFIPYTNAIEVVGAFLKQRGISYAVVDGGVSGNKRNEIFNAFQGMPDPKVLLIQPKAAAHGVTLTKADSVVFWSPIMSVETFIQAVARADRQGQVNKVTVYNFIGSAVERRVYDMLKNNIDVHTRITELYKEELENV